MDVVLLSRIQFALTIMFHYIFPPLTIGMGVVLVYLEAAFLRTGDRRFHQAAKFWTRIFALNFAIGKFDPAGYHVLNIAIHWLTGLAIYWFTRNLIRTPRIADTITESTRVWLPLFVPRIEPLAVFGHVQIVFMAFVGLIALRSGISAWSRR